MDYTLIFDFTGHKQIEANLAQAALISLLAEQGIEFTRVETTFDKTTSIVTCTVRDASAPITYTLNDILGQQASDTGEAAAILKESDAPTLI